MAAFTHSQFAYIQWAVEKMHARACAADMLELTYQDVLDWLCPPIYHATLWQAPEIIKQDKIEHIRFSCTLVSREPIGIKHVELGIMSRAINGLKRPFLPAYPLPQGTNADLGCKVHDWVLRRIRLGKDWGRVSSMVMKLNGLCSSPAQVRHHWPAILPLLQLSQGTRELADQLNAPRRPRGTKPLPFHVRQQLGKTGTTVAQCLLLPGHERVERPITVKVISTYQWDEGGFVFDSMAEMQ